MASSQPSSFAAVPFSASFPQQSFRLLELSPDLVEIIEAQRQASSKRRKLWFKSSLSSSAATAPTRREASDHKEGFLHLCSAEKIWAVKQVSTSNSVHVTRMVSAAEVDQLQIQEKQEQDKKREEGMEADEDISMAMDEADACSASAATDTHGGGGITAISQVKNILELIEVKPGAADVERMVREMVPMYHDDHSGTTHTSLRDAMMTLSDIFDNISAPTTPIIAAMKRLFLFGVSIHPSTLQDKSTRHSSDTSIAYYIPSPAQLLGSWRLFAQQCTISNCRIDEGLNYFALRDLLMELREEDAVEKNEVDFERNINIILAILRRLALDRDANVAQTKGVEDDEEPSFHVRHDLDCAPFTSPSIATTNINLDPALTRDFVGRWLLLAQLDAFRQTTSPSTTSASLPMTKFLAEWTDLLPTVWARSCDRDAVHELVATVQGVQISEDEKGSEIIAFGQCGVPSNGIGSNRLSSGAVKQRGSAENAKLPDQNSKKRKWHEKFGAQRAAAATAKK